MKQIFNKDISDILAAPVKDFRKPPIGGSFKIKHAITSKVKYNINNDFSVKNTKAAIKSP